MFEQDPPRMSYCPGSVPVGRTTKSVKVLLSSGAELSYVSERVAADLQLPLFTTDTVTIAGGTGEQVTCTQSASIDLTLNTFTNVVNVLVVPGTLPYLVLGMDWFVKYNPQFGFREDTTISVTGDRGVRHTMQMMQDDSKILFIPQMRVVSRVMSSQATTRSPPPNTTLTTSSDKSSKAFSRNRIVKEGWGSRRKFQASYGLTMSPDDIQEGNEILKAMEKADKATSQSN